MNFRRCFQFVLTFAFARLHNVCDSLIFFFFFCWGTILNWLSLIRNFWNCKEVESHITNVIVYIIITKYQAFFPRPFRFFVFFLNTEYLLLSRKVNKQLWFIFWVFLLSHSSSSIGWKLNFKRDSAFIVKEAITAK